MSELQVVHLKLEQCNAQGGHPPTAQTAIITPIIGVSLSWVDCQELRQLRNSNPTAIGTTNWSPPI